MTASVSTSSESQKAFELKGRVTTLTTLKLFTTDLQFLKEELENKVAQAPDFFGGAPVIVDASDWEAFAGMVSLADAVATIRQVGFIPVGFGGIPAKLQAQADELGLPVFANLQAGSKRSEAESSEPARQKPAIVPAKDSVNHSPTMLVTQPVRSGQQIYARGGDLIIMASVSAGSEILADGNIHVYGTLRGRALAGVRGDENTRIFCQNMEAELISVAGQYWVNEDIPESYRGKSVQVFVVDDALTIGNL